jgi:hypothetical protein
MQAPVSVYMLCRLPDPDITGYILHGTVGEPIAGNLSLQTTYGLGSGFWWPHQ